MPVFRRLVVAAVAAAVAAFMIGSGAGAQTASPDDTATLLIAINADRAAAGLAPLTVAAGLTAAATDHSADMASSGTLEHSADLLVLAPGSVAAAENIGTGTSVTQLAGLFTTSTAHEANILGDYTSVGIAVVTDASGQLWVTELFARPATATATAPAPAPAPAPGPVPAPVVAAPAPAP